MQLPRTLVLSPALSPAKVRGRLRVAAWAAECTRMPSARCNVVVPYLAEVEMLLRWGQLGGLFLEQLQLRSISRSQYPEQVEAVVIPSRTLSDPTPPPVIRIII